MLINRFSTIFYFFLLHMLLQCCAFTVKVMTQPGCRQNGNTLSCNILPKDIPYNIINVHLQDVRNLCNIVKGDFHGNNWNHIKCLHISVTPGSETCQQTIGHYALDNLIGLEEFKILSRVFIGLENNSFAGLTNLKTLSFTGCIDLHVDTITKALDGQLPNLEILTMTYIDIDGFNMGKDFCNMLSVKPIKQVNLHHLAIDHVNLGCINGLLDTLEILNVSGSTIIDANTTGTETKTFKNLKLLDASYAVLPKYMLGFLKYLPKIIGHFYILNFEQEKILSHIETVDLTGTNQQIPVNLDNLTIFLSINETWTIEHIILRHNQLGHLDVMVPCDISPFKVLDLSFNSIDFLQPNLCKCCFNLKQLNLENNLLFKMARHNFSVFEKLTMFYTNLENINLAKNKLTRIPSGMFQANRKLKIINLSENFLKQITFKVDHLNELMDLDLRKNQISVLDETSLKHLHAFEGMRRYAGNTTNIINLDFNPLSCSTCTSLDSVTWIARSKMINRKNLVCTNENGRDVQIDQDTVTSVISLCNQASNLRNKIVISVLTPVSVVIMLVILFCSVRRCRNKRQYKQRMEEKLHLIQENKLDTEYVVFLSFSSYDHDFLTENVYRPLLRHLQDRTKCERDLICLGDKHFQLGRPINDEMVVSLTKSAVILILLSHNFCSSDYCRMEFDLALQLNKPIILIVKDDVDPNDMVPSLREIFHTRTRILWEQHDGDEYKLKTTWDNVCTSILELIPYH